MKPIVASVPLIPADQNFFQTNLFLAIITFIVGCIGLYLYYRGKRDEKRRIAKIIKLEIENAQTELKDAKKKILSNPEDPLPEHLFVMPTDTWSTNKHLFIEDFSHTEWNAINDFYGHCEIFDEAIRHNDARFGEQEKELRRNVHQATYVYTMEYSEKLRIATTDDEREELNREFFKKRNAAVEMLIDGKYTFIFTPNKQNAIAQNCLKNIDMNLSLGSVGQALESLSKSRFIF